MIIAEFEKKPDSKVFTLILTLKMSGINSLKKVADHILQGRLLQVRDERHSSQKN